MFAFAAVLLIGQAAATQAAPPPPPKCDAPEYAAFDFWIGEWDVYPNGKDTQVARSRVEKLYNGCAIRENWMPLKGADGGSLSGYNPATHRWHQTWIGSAPGVIQFEGGPASGQMTLTGWWPGSGPKGEDGLTRMTYSRVDGGVVRQFGEFSADHGLTWIVSFDFLYRPHRESTP
jgi:hypothetical protein